MSEQNVIDLFKGFAVLVDDAFSGEEELKDDPIHGVKKALEDVGLATVAYDKVPPKNVHESLTNASFVIADWNMKRPGERKLEDSGVVMGSSQMEDVEERRNDFIKWVADSTCVPIFVFSAAEVDRRTVLSVLGLPETSSRIMVKSKHDVCVDSIVKEIQDWCTEDPGMYALKVWEHSAKRAKREMFQHFDSLSSNWATILWQAADGDGFGHETACFEFGDVLTRNLVNRMDSFCFDQKYLAADVGSDGGECVINKVLKGERFIDYGVNGHPVPEIAYTGDLYHKRDSETYYLNIRAQCSLRGSDPSLYLIKGCLYDSQKLLGCELFTDEGMHLPGAGMIGYQDLAEYVREGDRLCELNAAMRDYPRKVNGLLVGKSSEVFVLCLQGSSVLRFRLDIEKVIKFKKANSDFERLGRLIPPYITDIQQKCASHIVRNGLFPAPLDEILS